MHSASAHTTTRSSGSRIRCKHLWLGGRFRGGGLGFFSHRLGLGLGRLYSGGRFSVGLRLFNNWLGRGLGRFGTGLSLGLGLGGLGFSAIELRQQGTQRAALAWGKRTQKLYWTLPLNV